MDNNKDSRLIPASIIAAGFLIALAVIYSKGEISKDSKISESNTAAQGKSVTSGLDNLRPIDSGDHILGNPDAVLKIVEYSDLECPFCKTFHKTMHQIMDEYGKDGRVAWVYRHLPIASLHPRAFKESEASECANDLGGNQKFWAYIDRIFEITPSNNGLDPNQLLETARALGFNESDFKGCLDSGRHSKRISEDISNASKIGVDGTPYSIVVLPDGKKLTLSGARPYEEVRAFIDQALGFIK